MLFSIDKNKSLTILQTAIALFAFLAPAASDAFVGSLGIYIILLFVGLLFVMRMKKTRKVYFSAMSIAGLTLLAYSFVSSLWAHNREGQLLYLIETAGVCMFFSAVIDYFMESNTENVKRRMMYLLVAGGVLCAVRNVLHWIFFMIPVASVEAFSKGMGSKEFLSVFMIVCLCCSCSLFKGSSPSRKRALSVFVVLSVFVFVMAKSAVGWITAFFVIIMVISKKYFEKRFVPVGVFSAIIFTGIISAATPLFDWGSIFADLFSYGTKNLFGSGGGVLSGQELFARTLYKGNTVGLLPMLFAQSGILGLVFCVITFVRSLMLFLKLRSYESIFCVFLTAMIMLVPPFSYVTVLLWTALFAYNEQAAEMCFSKEMKKESSEKSEYAILIFCVVIASLCVQSLMKLSADIKFKNEEYLSAYSLYTIGAKINITDSESCRMAAKSIRKSGKIKESHDEAIALVNKAIKRDSKNLENIVEKARIYNACGEYELSAGQYRAVSQKAASGDKYNLELSRVLYKIVRKNPKGSSETKRAYEEILLIAGETKNLDYRKKINDIADKASVYTKEALESEIND